MKTTVFLFHPNFANSRVNKALAAGLPGDIEVRDMYALYPDFQIDVAKEQAVMEASDRIVLQTPMYWYSGTPLLKKWEDDVLTYGWAYGSDGNALHGKELLVAITPGGRQLRRRQVRPVHGARIVTAVPSDEQPDRD